MNRLLLFSRGSSKTSNFLQRKNVVGRKISIEKESELKRKVIGVYSVVPEDLFRINSKRKTELKTKVERRKEGYSNYDVDCKEEGKDGIVFPLEGNVYQGPNGASARPNSIITHLIVSLLDKAKIYRIPKGTPLPEELSLVHEHSNHHSFQPAKSMTLSQFNQSLDQFFQSKGQLMTKKQFKANYPIEKAFELDSEKIIQDLGILSKYPSK